MAGMSLRTGVSAGASFNPGMPVAAATPSGGGMGKTISQQAYGVSSGVNIGPKRAAIGSVSVGVLALATMIFIWWSLPR